jgi:hypothetical protein
MELNKIIFLIMVLHFIMDAPVMPVSSLPAIGSPVEQIQKFHSLEIESGSIIMAQTKSQTAKSDTQKSSAKEDQATKSGTAKTESNRTKSNHAESKPLKPFKPSEEIAAEQAVDFPADI